MKRISSCVTVLFLLLAAGALRAEEPKADPFDKLMSLSGLKKQVAEFPGLVAAGIEQARGQGLRIPEPEFEGLIESIMTAFQPSEILSALAVEVKKNTSEADARELLEWYESELGRRITKAEEDASTPAAYQAMVGQAQALLADDKMVEFARKLDGLVHATDSTMQIQAEAGLATFTAISKAMNPLEPVKYEVYNAQLRAEERQMRASIEELVTISFVYSYKGLDPASLQKYLEFNAGPKARSFNESVMRGMKLAMDKLTENLAEAVAVKFKKQI